MKGKMRLIIAGIIGLILAVLIFLGFFIVKEKEENKKEGIDTSKQDKAAVVKGQEEVTKLVKSYVDGNYEKIKEYAEENSKVEFTIKELKGIFEIDTKKFNELKYGCSEDNTFIKLNNDYKDYVVVLGCSDFYID